jgi:hypothetical protein
MPIVNAEMHKVRSFLPRIARGSRFYNSLEGYWPLVEGQGMKCNSLVYPCAKANKYLTGPITFTKSIPFGMTLRLDTDEQYKNSLQVENSNLGMWTRFDAIEEITMAIWVKLDTRVDFEPFHPIYGFGNTVGLDEYLGFMLEDGSNKVGFQIYTGEKANYTPNLADNTWYFLAATWKWYENLIRLYLNGVQTTTAATTQHINPDPLPYIYIGWDSSADGVNLTGNFFGAAFWTRALSAQDIYYLYTNPFELLGTRKYPELNGQAAAGRISDFMPFF